MHICSVAYNLKFFGLLQQNNLSNPPTPPASLPPTPPPMACQKMANGFATTEELAGKAGVLVSHEGMINSIQISYLWGLCLWKLCVYWVSAELKSSICVCCVLHAFILFVCFCSHQSFRTEAISAAFQTSGWLASSSHCSRPEDSGCSCLSSNTTSQ